MSHGPQLVAAMGHEVPQLSIIWPEIERTMDIFETHSVAELLFEGWSLPYFNFNFNESHIPGLEDINVEGTLPEILELFGIPVPEALKENKIGYYSFVS